ncbi:hypothetical protein LJR175_000986 [Variovorax sp. LjRoot175]|uniref:hypothetical protein n=1 Tax=Variovorax sp. LjRoot175 TaxID=3342276 RepID=UPI003ECE00C7
MFKRLWMALATGRAHQRGEQEYAGYAKEQTLAILPIEEGDQHLLVTRAELHRWLQAVGLRTAYLFLRPEPQPSVAPAPHIAETTPADSADVVDTRPDEPAKERRARRYRACIDAGLEMPDNDYSPLPRGIVRLAKAEGITRQSYSEDIKAHIRYLAQTVDR